MFFSRTVDRVTRPDSRPAPRIRGWLLLAAAGGAGIIAGLAAASGSGPFDGLRPHVASNLAGNDTKGTPIDAGTLFPPVKPAVVKQVVTVYDPPPAGWSAPPPVAHPTESDDQQPSSQPSRPEASPTPSGGGGDN